MDAQQCSEKRHVNYCLRTIMKLSFWHIIYLFLASVGLTCCIVSCVGTTEEDAQIDRLLAEADSLFQLSEMQQAMDVQMQAYKIASTDVQRACIQVDMAQVHYFVERIDEAISNLEQSIAIFEDDNDLSATARGKYLEALMLYADILNFAESAEKAMHNYQKAARIALEVNDLHSYVVCQMSVIKFYSDKSNYLSALVVCREMLSHCSKGSEDMEIDKFSALFRMQWLLSVLGDYPEAQNILNEMRLMTHDKSMRFVVNVAEFVQGYLNPFTPTDMLQDGATRLCNSIAETGLTDCYEINVWTLLGTYYIRIKDFKSAKKCVDNYRNIAQNDKMDINNVFFHLLEAEVLLHYSKTDSAYSILTNEELIKKCQDIVNLNLEYNRVLSLYYSICGNYQKEYDSATKMAVLADSVQTELLTHNLAYHDLVYQRDTTILINSIRISQKQSKLDKFAFWQAVWVIIIVVAILVVLIIVLSVIIKTLKEREHEIYKQNVHLQNEVMRHTSILEAQKVELQQTNDRLTREIRYAGRIQRDILSSELVLNSPIIKGHFVYYKPCQNISGDFYWFYTLGDHQFVLCADATGHGIPGAFISMVCSTLLNDIVSTSEPSAAELVRTLDIRLRAILRNNSNTHANDSIDASLVCINNKTGRITISLARHKARIVRKNGTIEYIQGVKRSIGDIDEAFIARPFVEESCHFEQGDMLYLTSDGLESQFGGIDGRKLKTHRMDEMFKLMAQYHIREQRDYLDKFFRNWKGDCEQTDDVLVIGLAF